MNIGILEILGSEDLTSASLIWYSSVCPILMSHWYIPQEKSSLFPGHLFEFIHISPFPEHESSCKVFLYFFCEISVSTFRQAVEDLNYWWRGEKISIKELISWHETSHILEGCYRYSIACSPISILFSYAYLHSLSTSEHSKDAKRKMKKMNDSNDKIATQNIVKICKEKSRWSVVQYFKWENNIKMQKRCTLQTNSVYTNSGEIMMPTHTHSRFSPGH